MKHKLTLTICSLMFLGIWYFMPESEVRFALLLSMPLLALGITAYGSYQIKANYFLKAIHRGKPIGIALTFDDGIDAEITPLIVHELNKANVKATFFVIGSKLTGNEALLKQMVLDGHTIANHSTSHHKAIGVFSKPKLKQDILACSLKIEQIIGFKPLFFRPPFGVTNPNYASVLTDLNLHAIGWTIRSLDTTISKPAKLLQRIKKQLVPGAILLLHDNQRITLEVLPQLLSFCLESGIKIVSLSELIDVKPYENN